MQKKPFPSSAVFQFIVTFASLFVVGLIFFLSNDDEADMVRFVFMIGSVFIALLFIGPTIALCFAIGLPIRLNAKINQWWKARPLIPVVGIAIAILLLLIAFEPKLIETLGQEYSSKEIPNIQLFLSGWFLLAFSLLHFYPASLRNLFRR